MKLEQLIGNEEKKIYINECIKDRNILHSYLFNGPDGVGKKLFAQNFAKRILCLESGNEECTCKSCTCFEGNNHPDYFILNSDETTIKIDDVRQMTKKIYEKPIVSNHKVYIINAFDKMTIEAQNALLKTLEEPPSFVTIILVTSYDNNILNTIKSRCMSVRFNRISEQEILNYIKDNLNIESTTPNMLKYIDGSISRAIDLTENKDLYIQIEEFAKSLTLKNKVDIMQVGKVLYDKENIYEILDYLIVCLYSQREENIKYLGCIKIVNDCISRLKSNSNFDMCIDMSIIKMWEEINEISNRNKI